MATEKQMIAREYNHMLFRLEGVQAQLLALRWHGVCSSLDKDALLIILGRIRTTIKEMREEKIARVDKKE